SPLVCDDGNACTVDSCNEVTDSCDNVPDDAACDNGLFCDGIETCDPVLDCRVGSPLVCDDGNACTVDSCNEATDSCDNLPDDAACDNGLFCDGIEVCNATQGCQVGAPPDCTGMADQCNEGICDDSVGMCIATPVPDGTSCDNGDGCAGDTCRAGFCVPFNCGPPPPAAPINLIGEIGEKAALAWEPNTEPDLAWYNVYRSTAAGGPYAQVATQVSKPEFKELPPPGFYCYVVTAVNTGGSESPYSNEICGTIINGG
ncbi:MAG: fibronectin type III domain-containing protein, partial [Phycisphaerae bacterium]